MKQTGQGSDAEREVQGGTFEGSHSSGSLKGKQVLQDPITCAHVEARGGGVDYRKEEIEVCIRSEGDKWEGPSVGGNVKRGAVSHTPALLEVEIPNTPVMSAVGPACTSVAQLDPGCGSSNSFGPSASKTHFSGEVQLACSVTRGVQNHFVDPSPPLFSGDQAEGSRVALQEVHHGNVAGPFIPLYRGKEGVSVNHHIRFLSDESDISEFSDSIEELVSDDQRMLKLRQRNTCKKKSLSLANKHLGVDLEAQLGGSPKRWKKTKENIRFARLIEERCPIRWEGRWIGARRMPWVGEVDKHNLGMLEVIMAPVLGVFLAIRVRCAKTLNCAKIMVVGSNSKC